MKGVNKIVILVEFLLLVNIINCHLKPTLFKCEHNSKDENNPISPVIVKTSVKEQEALRRRIEASTDEEGFQDFHIYLDLANIEKDIDDNKLSEQKEFFISSMKKAVEVLQSLLKVKPLQKDYQLSNANFGQLNIQAWNKSVFGNGTRSFRAQGIHLAIFGMLADLGEGTLATASARGFQEGEINEGQPYVGVVKINKMINYTLPNSKEYFQSILVHEFTHILGFSKNFFEKYYKNIFYEKDQYGIMRAYLNSTKVLDVAKKYYDCPDLKGVELENQGGNGTEGSHWEARILLGEYMNGYSYTEEMVISEFTLAVLEDSGYYKANYYTGGLMRFGKHKGCEFLKERCINPETHKMNPKFENEFFDSISRDTKGIEASCSSGRQSRTYNAFFRTDDISDVPEEYRYFEDLYTLAYQPADFCPVPLKMQEEEDLSYFAGHCSAKGSGIYGSSLYYYSDYFNSSSEALLETTGENLTDHSFCFLSSLAKDTQKNADFISITVRANCYEIFCSEKSLTLKIFDDYIVCPRAGGKIEVEGYKGYLLCPDYNLMCSGSEKCNDIFDCIEKKSVIKDNAYTYDYEIKTSQNIQKSKEEKCSTDNYELSEDGQCSVNCKKCKEKKECLQCRDGFSRYLQNDGYIVCYSNENYLEKGYFLNSTTNMIEKCMDNCLICSDTISCGMCEANHIYKQKKCEMVDNSFILIDNCLEYDKDNLCTKCNAHWGFNQTNRDKCLSLENELKGHFTRDNGVSYYPCSNLNENCTDCYFDKEILTTVCTKCVDDLLLLYKDKKGACKEKEEIENNTKYFVINETHAGECAKAIENCLSCNNSIFCNKCKYGYKFFSGLINDTFVNGCINKTIVKELEKQNQQGSINDPDGYLSSDLDCSGSDLLCDSISYFSLVNILLVQAIYIMMLLII